MASLDTMHSVRQQLDGLAYVCADCEVLMESVYCIKILLLKRRK